jgi:hypothetical protein
VETVFSILLFGLSNVKSPSSFFTLFFIFICKVCRATQAVADPSLLWPRFCDRLEAIGVIGAVREAAVSFFISTLVYLLFSAFKNLNIFYFQPSTIGISFIFSDQHSTFKLHFENL